ncbi:hypothetical protein [Rhodococcus sp. 14-2470-1a]|nr:hypothetical protein [Rhodococcus sp. 14-2470-1a]
MEVSNNIAVAQWRQRIALHLQEAVNDEDLRPVAVDMYADLIMTTMIGL